MSEENLEQSRKFKQLYGRFLAEHKGEWKDDFLDKLQQLYEIEAITYLEQTKGKVSRAQEASVFTTDPTIPDWTRWAQILWTSLERRIEQKLRESDIGGKVLSECALVSDGPKVKETRTVSTQTPSCGLTACKPD